MKYHQGHSREQLHIVPVSMESAMGADHEVRMIALFVGESEMGLHGFRHDHFENNCPAFANFSRVMLKIW